jgi:hypothetical protein
LQNGITGKWRRLKIDLLQINIFKNINLKKHQANKKK